MVYCIWWYLEVQGTHSQTTALVTNHLKAPEIKWDRLEVGYKYSYGLVVTTLGPQVGPYQKDHIPPGGPYEGV